MSSKFLLPFLGFWLLLSQSCRARVTEEWLDEVIKVCDRRYVRTVIEICGTSLLVDRKEPARRQRSITGEHPWNSPHLSCAVLPNGCPSRKDLALYGLWFPSLRFGFCNLLGLKNFNENPSEGGRHASSCQQLQTRVALDPRGSLNLCCGLCLGELLLPAEGMSPSQPCPASFWIRSCSSI